VKTKKREDGLGLGMDQVTDHAGNKAWSANANAFNGVLDLLKQTYKKPKKKTKTPTIEVGIK
jgi:hypothetical protein